MSLLVYRFQSSWALPAPPEEVIRLLEDVSKLPEWLPRVVPRVDVMAERSGEYEMAMWIRGWLPHSLKVHLRSRNCGGRLVIHSSGDLGGSGRWLAAARGQGCELTFQCRIRARNPLLAVLSIVFRPICVSNHRWVMRRVREGLEKRLAGSTVIPTIKGAPSRIV